MHPLRPQPLQEYRQHRARIPLRRPEGPGRLRRRRTGPPGQRPQLRHRLTGRGPERVQRPQRRRTQPLAPVLRRAPQQPQDLRGGLARPQRRQPREQRSRPVIRALVQTDLAQPPPQRPGQGGGRLAQTSDGEPHVVRHLRLFQGRRERRQHPGVPEPGQRLDRRTEAGRSAGPLPHPTTRIGRHPRGQGVGGGRGQREQLLQHVRGGLGQTRLRLRELSPDQPHQLRVIAAPGAYQPAAHPYGVDALPGIGAAQLVGEQGCTLLHPVVQPHVQRPQQVGRPGCRASGGLLGGERAHLAHQRPGGRPLGRGIPGGRLGPAEARPRRDGAQLPQQPRHHRHHVCGQGVGRAPGELGEGREPQAGRVRLRREAAQPVGGLPGQRAVAQGHPARRLHEGEAHLLRRLHGQPFTQQGQHPGRTAVQGGERQRGGEAHARVLVGHQLAEHPGTGGDGGRGHRVVRGALDLVLVDLLLVVLAEVDAADAREQFHDAAPVLDAGVDDQFEEEGDAGERARVHVALVVDRAVHPVEGGLPLGRIGRGEPPQQYGHVVGRPVGVLHRCPVDLVDPREHAVPSPFRPLRREPGGPCPGSSSGQSVHHLPDNRPSTCGLSRRVLGGPGTGSAPCGRGARIRGPRQRPGRGRARPGSVSGSSRSP